MTGRMNLLFVCRLNMDKSPTAERLFAWDSRYNVCSAGTTSYARRKVTERLLSWADKVFVMESDQELKIRMEWPELAERKGIYYLGIEDDYRYRDPSLEKLIAGKMADLGFTCEAGELTE